MEPPNSTEESLEDFRRQWQEEISLKKINQESAESLGAFSPSDSQCESIDSRTVEDKATSLYLQGVKCEQNGDMLEAIRHYKQAIKLVPNIEELVYAARVAPVPTNNVDIVTLKMSATTLNGDINESQVKNNCDSTDLFSKLVRIVEEDGQICTPLEEPKNVEEWMWRSTNSRIHWLERNVHATTTSLFQWMLHQQNQLQSSR